VISANQCDASSLVVVEFQMPPAETAVQEHQQREVVVAMVEPVPSSDAAAAAAVAAAVGVVGVEVAE